MGALPFSPVILWLDPEEDLAAWRCPTPLALVDVLAETPHFEFFGRKFGQARFELDARCERCAFARVVSSSGCSGPLSRNTTSTKT